MVEDGVFGASFVEVFLNVRREVGKELLGKGTRPFSNTGRGGGVQGGDKGEEGLEHVGG